MYRLISFIFLMLSASLSAQMFVSPASYVYATDRVVYVTQDIDLQNNGNIYLRNEAQLLQGTTGSSGNKGLGKLSVFQEGTSDNFDYNYWCSPVGNPSALSGNEAFGISMLNSPTTQIASTPALMLSNTALDGIANPLSIAPRWIYRFLSSATYSQWLFTGSVSSIEAGQGFTMKGTSGTDATIVDGSANNSGSAQRYDFRGKPNDGNISVNVAADNLTLTGNPYPSALHINAFLLDGSNAASNGIAYYWEQNKTINSHFLTQYQGGYGTYSPISLASNGIYVPATFDTYDGSGAVDASGTSSGLSIERKYAPIGQGFMVKGLTTGSVTLKNSHRAYYKESGALSQFERSASDAFSAPEGPTPHFRVNINMNDQHTRQLALALIPEATDGIDRGIDAVSPAPDDLPNDAYFVLDNDKYVIQGIAFDPLKRIKVGVKSANNSTYTFKVAEVFNFDQSQPIFLFDSETGLYHNIRSGECNVVLNQGVYNDRFEITFTDSALAVNENSAAAFSVLQDNAAQELVIDNPNGIALLSCALYDMAGKLIFSAERPELQRQYRFSTGNLSEGIYLVKVTSSGRSDFGTKISVTRKSN